MSDKTEFDNPVFLGKNSDREFRIAQFEIPTILGNIESDISGSQAWNSKVQRLPEKGTSESSGVRNRTNSMPTNMNCDNSGVRQQGMRTSSDSHENADPKNQEFRRNGMQKFTDAHKTCKSESSGNSSKTDYENPATLADNLTMQEFRKTNPKIQQSPHK